MGAMCVKQVNHVLLFRSACEPVPLEAEGERRGEGRTQREKGDGKEDGTGEREGKESGE